MALFILRPLVGGGYMNATPISPLRINPASGGISVADNASWTRVLTDAALLALFDGAPNQQLVLTAINTAASTVMQIISMPGASAPTTEIGDWIPPASKDWFTIDRSTVSLWFRVAAIT